MYFRNYGIPKTWLHQCVKSPVSEDPSKSRMANVPQHCSNLKKTPFTIFRDHCEFNSRIKSLC